MDFCHRNSAAPPKEQHSDVLIRTRSDGRAFVTRIRGEGRPARAQHIRATINMRCISSALRSSVISPSKLLTKSSAFLQARRYKATRRIFSRWPPYPLADRHHPHPRRYTPSFALGDKASSPALSFPCWMRGRMKYVSDVSMRSPLGVDHVDNLHQDHCRSERAREPYYGNDYIRA